MANDFWQSTAAAWPLPVALILGFITYRILLAVDRRAQLHVATRMRARIAKVVAMPAALGLCLLFLSIAVGATPLPDGLSAQVRHWLGIGGLLCLTWLAVRTVGALEQRVMREHPVSVADNLAARRVQTQVRVLGHIARSGIVLIGLSIALMTFPAIRQIGTTLLASAGVVGLVAGFAAKPVLGNLIAGLQIALTQPIRIDDVVIVEGEWGRIDEITSAYVVVRIWDERRLVVPLQWFIEHPFENWTRSTAQLLGTSFLWLDYRTPMAEVRAELERICSNDPRWDGRVCVAQVTDTGPSSMQVRLLVSARNSGDLFDLRCAVREQMIAYLDASHEDALPRLRMRLAREDGREFRATSAAAEPKTTSPGAEDVNAADLAAMQAERAAQEKS